jgi:lysyl-tRNA synthetase, class II
MDSIISRIESYSSLGHEIYPHSFKVSSNFKDYISKYDLTINKGEIYNGKSGHIDIQLKEEMTDLAEMGLNVSSDFSSELPLVVESIAGRIIGKRGAGKLVFYTIKEGEYTLQLMVKKDIYEDSVHYEQINKVLGLGFYIGATGYVSKTKTGELSLAPLKIVLLSPCYHSFPKYSGIADPELRSRKRYLDLMSNNDSYQKFKTRSKIISLIRTYLENLDFIEVETPILASQVGGAVAKPFKTYHNDLKQDMVMRISPELFLKELVIGGFERVFEIGKQFRNESIDTTHNPEFTTLEFYAAKMDYHDLMKLCEDMISKIVLEINKSYIVKYKMKHDDEHCVEINFEPPFKRIDMMDVLEEKIGKLPKIWDNEEAFKFFENKCEEFKIDVQKPATISRMIDKLVGHFIEVDCKDPTFIINHPIVMSPLAKWHRHDSRKTERFELFCSKFEIANAYTELNDPAVQHERFEQQGKDRSAGDDEIPEKDNEFIEALEYGLPPTGGFGMGIDRFTMLLTNSSNIFDIILFPARTNKKILEE